MEEEELEEEKREAETEEACWKVDKDPMQVSK